MTNKWGSSKSLGEQFGLPDCINTNYTSNYNELDDGFYYHGKKELFATEEWYSEIYAVRFDPRKFQYDLKIIKIESIPNKPQWATDKTSITFLKKSDIELLKDIEKICKNDLLLDSTDIYDAIKIAELIYNNPKNYDTMQYTGQKRTFIGDKYIEPNKAPNNTSSNQEHT